MKGRRHSAILALVEDHAIESQEQLQRLLAAQGHGVNQATLSRDLRSLGIVKRPLPGRGARYGRGPMEPNLALAVANLRAFLREVVSSANLLVIRTRVGGAQPVGLALDQLGIPGLLGTVAGDDTVLGILAEGQEATQTIEAIWSVLEDGKEET